MYTEHPFVLAHEAALVVAYISHSQTIVARKKERERNGVHIGKDRKIPSKESNERGYIRNGSSSGSGSGSTMTTESNKSPVTTTAGTIHQKGQQ